jgi:hypothetical protein
LTYDFFSLEFSSPIKYFEDMEGINESNI